MPKIRVFEVVQYEKNPKTGEDLHFNEENIISALEHKSIKEYAYIRHDKDLNTEEDDANDIGAIGTQRPAHWHCVCRSDAPLELSAIARWFGVPENCIDIPRGRDAFLDKVRYLTHEDEKQQAKGKHLYDDEEVKSNFDFRERIDELMARKSKYGQSLQDRDVIRYEVLYNGLTIRQLIDKNPIAYQQDYSTLDKFRYKYITDRAPMPKTRINYYVCGRGGVGKGLICRAIARSLFPDLVHDDDIFFEVGAKGAPFEGYDGQPVIIWNDRRAIDLLTELNGRGNVFNVFDTHPTRQRQNVKYSSVCLTNEVNIVNSVQEYTEFLDGLAGEYKDKDGETHEVEDKGQSYRRFPFIVPLHENDFDLLMNKGFYKGTKEYDQYISYRNIRGNMEKIAIACGRNEELAKRLQAQAVKPITDKHVEILEKMQKEDKTEEEILAMFADVGVFDGEPVQTQLDDFLEVHGDELPFG